MESRLQSAKAVVQTGGDLQQMKTLLKQRDSTKPEAKELQTAYEKLAKEVSRLEKH